MQVFSTLKAFFYGLIAILGAVGILKYKRAVTTAEESKKETEAVKKQMKVQEEVHQDEVSTMKMKEDIAVTSAKIEKEIADEKTSTIEKISSTPDNQEYEIKL